MDSQEKDQNGADLKQKKTRFIGRLTRSIVLPSSPTAPSIAFDHYSHYLHRTSVTEEYTVERLLGAVTLTQGALGTVHLCRSVFLGTLCAIKYTRVTSQSVLEAAVGEYETLSKLQHPHIISVYGFHLQPETKQTAMLMESVQGQSLNEFLLKEWVFTGTVHTETEVKSIAWQLFSVLRYLEEQCIVHRDLNPANILYTAEGQVVLIDFQTACSLRVTQPVGVTGTAGYQAPEMWEDQSYGYQVDVWALGKVLQRLLRTCKATLKESALKVVDMCLMTDPDLRCSASQALESSWFS